MGNGNGTFKATVTYTVENGPHSLVAEDFNGDGYLDLATQNAGAQTIYILLGNGDGTLQRYSSSAWGNNNGGFSEVLNAADFNSDGVSDLVATLLSPVGRFSLYLGETKRSTYLPAMHLLTAEARAESLDVIDSAMNRLGSEIGLIGAYQSRLEKAASVVRSTSDQYYAAAGRITDSDVAQTSAELVRTQILQQAATSVLAYSNQLPALALRLLTF